MKKTRIAICVLALFPILFSSMLSTADALPYHVSVAWGQPVTVSDQNERQAMSDTCAYITNLVNWGWAGSQWCATNYYGSMTNSTITYLSNAAVRDSSNYDYLSTFHCGDMFPAMLQYGHWEEEWYWDEEWQEWFPYYYYVVDGYVRHYAYYGAHYSSDGIIDQSLYYYTSSKNKFTFIWTCANGDLMDGNHYGYTDPHGTGIVGMPYAWLRSTVRNQNGYTNPDGSNYCYISFENVSRGLREQGDLGQGHTYGEFVRRFYYYALVGHYQIKYALDYAMQDMGRPNFDNSELDNGYFISGWLSRMRVYGDGNTYLPY